MDIKYLGHASFLIKTKTARVITDPFDPKMVGLKWTKQESDIITVSHHHGDHDYVAGVGGAPIVFDWPGEFEKMNVRIFGYQSYHDKSKGAERGENVVFKFETEDVSILHCGDLGHIPDDKFIDEVGEVDILMVPCGGKYTLDAAEAVEVVHKFDPYIVIPMHYNGLGMNPDVFSEVTGVEEFIKKLGMQQEGPVDKLSVKKEDLSTDQMRVVVMKITQ